MVVVLKPLLEEVAREPNLAAAVACPGHPVGMQCRCPSTAIVLLCIAVVIGRPHCLRWRVRGRIGAGRSRLLAIASASGLPYVHGPNRRIDRDDGEEGAGGMVSGLRRYATWRPAQDEARARPGFARSAARLDDVPDAPISHQRCPPTWLQSNRRRGTERSDDRPCAQGSEHLNLEHEADNFKE